MHPQPWVSAIRRADRARDLHPRASAPPTQDARRGGARAWSAHLRAPARERRLSAVTCPPITTYKGTPHAYIDAVGLAGDAKGLFSRLPAAHSGKLTAEPLERSDAWRYDPSADKAAGVRRKSLQSLIPRPSKTVRSYKSSADSASRKRGRGPRAYMTGGTARSVSMRSNGS
jgi:hypothetical protein